MSNTNPFFRFLNENRDMSQRYLYQQHINTCKVYENSKRIVLPSPESVDTSLSDVINNRISNNSFSPKPVSHSKLSTLLYWSVAELGVRVDGQGYQSEKKYRPHPSGGAKYPIETYVLLDQDGEYERGLYHYRPDWHQLELVTLLDDPNLMQNCKRQFNYTWVKDAGVVLLFSLLLERNMPKYGSLAYKLGLIEAGHIGQNIYLLASALRLHCCALGGLQEELFHSYLSIDGYNECLFYAIALGEQKL